MKLILETNFFHIRMATLDGRYCYITLDFATAASRNVVAITPQMSCLPVMILFHDCSMIKDERFK